MSPPAPAGTGGQWTRRRLCRTRDLAQAGQESPEGQQGVRGEPDELDATVLGNDPAVIRRFAQLGLPMIEAQEQIAKILGDNRHPYHDRWHPEHEKAVAEVQRLFQTVYGTRQAGTV